MNRCSGGSIECDEIRIDQIAGDGVEGHDPFICGFRNHKHIERAVEGGSKICPFRSNSLC